MNLRRALLPALIVTLAGSTWLLSRDVSAGGPATAARPATLPTQYRGLAVPSKQVIVTAPVDGILSKIHPQKNDVVKKDAVIAQMDDEIQVVVVEAAKLKADAAAQMNVAKIILEDAKLDEKKAQEQFDKKTLTEWELQKKIVARKRFEAEVEGVKEQELFNKSQFKLEDARLRRYVIRAPFDGTVIDIATEEGATLAHNDKVISLANLDELEARISMPASYFGKLEVGKAYRLLAGEPLNVVVPATLKTTSTVIDPSSGTFLCEFTILNPGRKMPAGFPVDFIVEGP